MAELHEGLIAPEWPELAEGEVNNFAVAMDKVLDAGESIAGVLAVGEVGSGDLTIDQIRVNTNVLAIGNRPDVQPGQAVLFRVAGQLAATGSYLLKITFTTDAVPSQTKIRGIHFTVAAL